ncbi:MAG TPA: hypothetical protein GX391_00530 [Firmicutes bacterium]|jgi:hypothetical protein|nr:hypothetical protein [Bacillota bacterium]HOQ23156.1 hypothetical protein [Bacillota bacterium]HPT66585.1 hypothetical protein [Bacillota bacterium]
MKDYKFALLIFCLLLIGGLSLAETDLQVYAPDWSYEVMVELARAGLVPEYAKVCGDKLTRLEMAYYLKTALGRLEDNQESNYDILSSVENINLLLKEYTAELRLLGITITDLASLTPSVKINQADEGFYDLDLVLTAGTEPELGQGDELRIDHLQESYYLIGEYHSPDIVDNIFFFLPENWLTTYNSSLLPANDRWEIMYTPRGDLELYFLVLRGSFPLEFQKVKGFFLFPIQAGGRAQNISRFELEQRVYNLLDKLSQNYEVNTLRQFKGKVPVPDLSPWSLADKGLEIGDYLVTTKLAREYNWERSLPEKASDTNSSLDLDLFLNSSANFLLEGDKAGEKIIKSYGSTGGTEVFETWDSLLRWAAKEPANMSKGEKTLKFPSFELPWQKRTDPYWLLMNFQMNTFSQSSEEQQTLQF